MATHDRLPITDRTKVKRQPQKGHYDRALIHQILDEALVIHVGFIAHHQPFVIPMGFGRDGDRLYIHGATASRMMQNLQQGVEVCVTATLLDGLVIARSLFHHSMNYRSVVLFGRATLVEDEAEKAHALKVLSEHMVPGRWDQARPPSPPEVKATTVLAFPIQRAPPRFALATRRMMPLTTRCRSGRGKCPLNSPPAVLSPIPA
jgi:nitroimidazol reductase NimA-like FMN-containing flavoprotein (pyridoxamine 5'-phosphate oxidase superfamily)